MRYDALQLHLQSDGGVSPTTLNGVNIYHQPHVQGGWYFDVTMPGRRIALHTALLYSRYGSTTRTKQSSNNIQETVNLNGGVATLYVGLRGFHNWSAYRLLAGTGFELHYYHDENQFIQYTSNGRPISRGYLYAGFAPSPLPYVEVGIQRNRLMLTLNARRYGKEIISVGFNDYHGRTWSTALALAYRLNGSN